MAKKVSEPQSIATQFETDLAENGLAGFFQKIVDRDDMSISVLSTGLPRLDDILHAKLKGLPRSRRIEIYSKDPEVGKTSIALQIGAHWQSIGQRVAIVDIEDTITEDYLKQLGYVLDPEPDSDRYAPYLAKGYDQSTGEVYTAEEIAEKIGKVARVVDLVIVDSIAALAKRADLERDPNDPSQPGGVGKILYDHCRRHTHTRATTIWINQALPQIGVFSPAGIKYKTSGGNAIPFFSSIRLELRLVEKLRKSKDDDPYGIVVDVFTAKNKVSPPYRHVGLTYLNDEGFSATWDLFEAAKAKKIIAKSGAWLEYAGTKVQGELNFYKAMKEDDSLRLKIANELAGKGNEEK